MSKEDDPDYYDSDEDDGSFLGWDHSTRESVLRERMSETNKSSDSGRSDRGDYQHGRNSFGVGGMDSHNYLSVGESNYPDRDTQHGDSRRQFADAYDDIDYGGRGRSGSRGGDVAKRASGSNRMYEEFVEGNKNMRLPSSRRNNDYDENSEEELEDDDGSEEESDDDNDDDFSATSSTDLGYDDMNEDCEKDRAFESDVKKSSLRVRVLQISCPLPSKLSALTSNFKPMFQLGLVKEASKSVFLFGVGKPKMINTYITSSNGIISNDDIDSSIDVRWDGLQHLQELFLGVELRIWGWYPEVMKLKMKESQMASSETQHDNASEDDAYSEGNSSSKMSTLDTVYDGQVSSNRSTTSDMSSLQHSQPQQQSQPRTFKGFVRNRMSAILMQGTASTSTQTDTTISRTSIASSTSNATPTTPSQSKPPDSANNLFHIPIKKKIPNIRIGTLLIPIQNISSSSSIIEKSYALNIKVSGGTRDMRQYIEKLFKNEKLPIIVTLRMDIQVSDSRTSMNSSEDEAFLQNLQMLEAKKTKVEKVVDETPNDDAEDLDADERFIEATFGSSKKEKEGKFPSSSNEKEKVAKEEEPTLKPGIVDYICIVGATDIGNQKEDDGSKGWLPTTPECKILEQFPSQTYHPTHGRDVILPEIVAWNCFPEGAKVWRGNEPPSATDLGLPARGGGGAGPPSTANLHHVSGSVSTNDLAAQNMIQTGISSASASAFDECLNSTTTLTWFVFKSNSDEYGSRVVKNYGVCIRFFVPAPTGIDRTQDDYAQNLDPTTPTKSTKKGTQLWVPMGICLMTSLPIVGVLEAMLLRICQTISDPARDPTQSSIQEYIRKKIYKDLANMIVNYPSPIHGVIHCSIPFLQGERFHITLPPFTGLPPLPHGGAVTAVCRLLGAEGFTILLAAFLTECKILLHSHDVSNVSMVAEVFCALLYPFSYVLPYIPVLPEQMLEFIESPVPYCAGVSSKSMKWIDRGALQDVVVIDLDNGFHTPDYFDGNASGNTGSSSAGSGRSGLLRQFKLPSPLPAAVCQSIHKSIFLLLRAEEDIEEQYGVYNMNHHMMSGLYSCFSYGVVARHLPRLETESLAEREFRIHVAIQLCSLVRGYQDCLFLIGASQPVFNRDKFLRYAPALFEERSVSSSVSNGANNAQVLSDDVNSSQTVTTQKILSPRSKRFLSLLTNTQHFYQLLERLDMEDTSFFHEIMDTFDTMDELESNTTNATGSDANKDKSMKISTEQRQKRLSELLESMELLIPTYKVDRRYFDKALKAIQEKKKMQNSSEDETEEPSDDVSDASDDEYDSYDDYSSELQSSDDESDDFNDLNHGIYDDSYYNDGSGGSSSENHQHNHVNFTNELLHPILPSDVEKKKAEENKDDTNKEDTEDGVHSLSVQYLIELEKNPWKYDPIFPDPEEYEKNDDPTDKIWDLSPKITLKQAIGEQKYRAYILQEKKRASGGTMEDDEDEYNEANDENTDTPASTAKSFRKSMVHRQASGRVDKSGSISLPNAATDAQNFMDPNQALFNDSEDSYLDLNTLLSLAYEHEDNYQKNKAPPPDAIRQCLSIVDIQGKGEGAIEGEFEQDDTMIKAAKNVLQSSQNAQKFLISVLSQRVKVEGGNNLMMSASGGGSNTSTRDVLNRTAQRGYHRHQFNEGRDNVISKRYSYFYQKNQSNAAAAGSNAAMLLSSSNVHGTHSTGGGGASTSGGGNVQNPSASTLSKLTFMAFKTIVKLCNAMLDTCMMEKLFENAYYLLSNTVGFCTYNKEKKVVFFMTATVSCHPIFASLKLWEKVMSIHASKASANLQNSSSNISMRRISRNLVDIEKDLSNKSQRGIGGSSAPGSNADESTSDASPTKKEYEYEAAVSTIYEMVTYGVSSELISQFAISISHKYNWFTSEYGKNIVILAKYLGLRRDDGKKATSLDNKDDLFREDGKDGVEYIDWIRFHSLAEEISEYASMLPATRMEYSHDPIQDSVLSFENSGSSSRNSKSIFWSEVSYFHPTTSLTNILTQNSSQNTLNERVGNTSNNSLQQHSHQQHTSQYANLFGSLVGSASAHLQQVQGLPQQQHQQQTSDVNRLLLERTQQQQQTNSNSKVALPLGYTGRTPVTVFGTLSNKNCIISGGLDGSIFFAHTLGFTNPSRGNKGSSVHGIKLEWENTSSFSSSCLNHGVSALVTYKPPQSSIPSNPNYPEDVLSSLEGSFIIAGSFDGRLNVWNARDAYYAHSVSMSNFRDDSMHRDMSGGHLGDAAGSSSVGADSPYEQLRSSVVSNYASAGMGHPTNSRNSLSMEIAATAGTPTSHRASSHLPYHRASASFNPTDALQKQPSQSIIGGQSHDRTSIMSSSAPVTTISQKKLDASLKGRSLGGHKNAAINCIHLPSPFYRPDVVFTGGSDGFIKVWTLRPSLERNTAVNRAFATKLGGGPAVSNASGGTGREQATSALSMFGKQANATTSNTIGTPSSSNDPTSSSNGDDNCTNPSNSCLSVLASHKSQVLSLKTYWHGESLLSGSSDKSIKVWDLNTSTCTNTFESHIGDVTHVNYWGNFIVLSGSSDRTICVHDLRIPGDTATKPIYCLRHHKSHISDLIVGSYTNDYTFLSASGDGTIATWDFRYFKKASKQQEGLLHIMRSPVVTMKHQSKRSKCSGSVLLSHGFLSDKTIFSASNDGIVREWDYVHGVALGEVSTGHVDAISHFSSFQQPQNQYYNENSGHYGSNTDYPLQRDNDDPYYSYSDQGGSNNGGIIGGLITAGWDGSVRFKKCHLNGFGSISGSTRF